MKTNEIIFKGQRIDLSDFTIEQLLDIRIEMDEEIAQIKDQLEESLRLYHEEGVAGDWSWIRRAKQARRLKSASVQKINLMIRKKKLIRIENDTFERTFMKAAKELLTEELYGALIERTHEMEDLEKETEDG